MTQGESRIRRVRVAATAAISQPSLWYVSSAMYAPWKPSSSASTIVSTISLAGWSGSDA